MVGILIIAAHSVHPSTAVSSTMFKYAMGLKEKLVHARNV